MAARRGHHGNAAFSKGFAEGGPGDPLPFDEAVASRPALCQPRQVFEELHQYRVRKLVQPTGTLHIALTATGDDRRPMERVLGVRFWVFGALSPTIHHR